MAMCEVESILAGITNTRSFVIDLTVCEGDIYTGGSIPIFVCNTFGTGFIALFIPQTVADS